MVSQIARIDEEFLSEPVLVYSTMRIPAYQARVNRIDEIGRAHAFERPAHVVQIEQLANDDLSPDRTQPRQPFVFLMNQSADRETQPRKCFYRVATGITGRASYQ